MTFVSNAFLIFFFITIIIYFIIPLRIRWIVLLISSIIFYALSGVTQLGFIISASLISYAAARWMEDIYSKQSQQLGQKGLTSGEKKKIKHVGKKKCRKILICALFLLLTVLVYCKIQNMVRDVLQNLFSVWQLDWMQVIVPLGISYYTFSLIGYLCDVYWKKTEVEKNYFHFLLFAIYFPKILQGPISSYKNLGSQLKKGQRFNYNRFCNGLQLLVWGYFKKLVVADRLAIFVSEVFDNCYTYTGLIFVIAAMLGSVQLYCDFSGCMDIAEGISQIFGIELEKNFNHPFFSRSAAEFWRRWHITLGEWFRDYVYMPLLVSPRTTKLGRIVKKFFGDRASKAVRVAIPLGVVWILTGAWHGTGYNYIAWGIYWGTIIIVSAIFEPEIKRLTAFLRINVEAESWKILQMVRTFFLFSFGRLITLPGHLRTTWDILKRIFTKFDIWILFDGSLYTHGLNQKNFVLAILSGLIVWGVGRLQISGSVRGRITNCNVIVRWMIYYAAIFAVIIFGVYGRGYNNSVFTYMNY